MVPSTILYDGPAVFVSSARRFLDVQLAEIRRERPDYIVHDSIAVWGQYAAELLAVPTIESISSFAFDTGLYRTAWKVMGRRTTLSDIWGWGRSFVQAGLVLQGIGRRYGLEDASWRDRFEGNAAARGVLRRREFQPCQERFGPLLPLRRCVCGRGAGRGDRL